MIENLTPAQQLFSLFYAIFFGLMLQTVGTRRSNPFNKGSEKNHDVTLNLFDTPNAWAIGFRYDNKPLWRFLLSVLLLNFFPGAIFAVIFLGLGSAKIAIGWVEILVIVWISLTPHYIYRVYLAIFILFRSELFLKKGEHDGYNASDINARQIIQKDRMQYKAHSLFFNHVAFPFFVVFPSVILLYNYVLLHDQFSVLNAISWIVLALGIVLFIAPRNRK